MLCGQTAFRPSGPVAFGPGGRMDPSRQDIVRHLWISIISFVDIVVFSSYLSTGEINFIIILVVISPSTLLSLSNLCSNLFQLLQIWSFFNVLLKQKFVILCRAENLLMQIMGHLHEQNFGTAESPLWPGVHIGYPLWHIQHTKCTLFDLRGQPFSLTATSGSLYLLFPPQDSDCSNFFPKRTF